MKLDTLKAAALAVTLSVTAAVPVALAQTDSTQQAAPEGRGHKFGRGMRHGGHRGMGFEGVNLTDAQKTQLRAVHESHRESTRALREEIRAKRQEVHQLSTAATFDEAAVRAKLTEVAALEAKLLGEQFRVRQEAQAILTPEQRTQLEQKRQEFKQRWQERKLQRQENRQERKAARPERSA